MRVEKEKFLNFVAELFDVPAGSLGLETAYQSIPQWDSVMHLRLVMETEEAFGISIPLDAVVSIATLGDLYERVCT